MKPGKIVFTGSAKDGTPLVIRYTRQGDAAPMQAYINTLSSERTHIRFQGKQLTIEEEESHVKKIIENIQKHFAVQLLVFTEEKLIGIADISMEEEATAHIGNFGITIAREYRKKGIGKLLTQLTLEEAQKNIPHLEIVSLSVFANNPHAISLYKSLGFVQYGSLPQGLIHKGVHIDHIYMYKRVREGGTTA